ncbi:Manganese/iron superoxide dismutase [Xylariales sp. PMI_506]|nr:Manganese/iron superoxide dismutase [Xylariales sp. PMI_506]
MFKPRLRIPRVSLPRQRPLLRRSLHAVPPLHYGAEGVPGLLSADGFNLAYTEYMQFVTEKLNALTAGTELEQKDTRQIISLTAREPSQAPIFNYASMAHNNHFFFKNLQPAEGEPGQPVTSKPSSMPERLRIALEDSFSSLETLRLEMSITANSMFGPGFVWLVKNHKTNQFRILTTYLAGSPYADAHWRFQGLDMNTVDGPTSSENTDLAREFLGRTQLGLGADNNSSWKKSSAPGGIQTIPLLCLNTWEHVWLRDYGIGAGGYGGKRMFIDNWWTCINWANVADAAQLRNRPLVE